MAKSQSKAKSSAPANVVSPTRGTWSVHCLHPECVAPHLAGHVSEAAAHAVAEAHADRAAGHVVVVSGTNAWDAKCMTDNTNLALGTSNAEAIDAANDHLAQFPDHNVKVWEE